MAHRAVFYLVVVPMLGLWLPSLMLRLGAVVTLMAGLSFAGLPEVDVEGAAWLPALGLSVPTLAFLVGVALEARRLRASDRDQQRSEVPLPPRQGKLLLELVAALWSGSRGAGRPVPRVILQAASSLTAHAYDDSDGQAIEMSYETARRAVRANPLALSVLRHETAHLVFRDLPSIRRAAMAVGGATLAIRAAGAACAAAVIAVVLAADLGEFPMERTVANVVVFHVAVLLAAALITFPLVLGRYLLRRYAGFLVALAETRADTSAGLWGDGLTAFSTQVENEPGLGLASTKDYGLAYLSQSLSHLPTQDRIALLRSPERLATPKLAYFAAAVVAVWLLTFHQGDAGWDAALLASVVALLQGVTVHMAVVARGHVELTWHRAALVGGGLVALQALPLISLEGLAYLAQHLVGAVVVPGGFGEVTASYMSDVWGVVAEFGRRIAKATGGPWFLLGWVLSAASLMTLFRMAAARPSGRPASRYLVLSVSAALCSVAVSYRFFQEVLYEKARAAAFTLAPSTEQPSVSWWEGLLQISQETASNVLWSSSELLHERPFLDGAPWLRLALPQLVTLALAVPLLRRFWRARE